MSAHEAVCHLTDSFRLLRRCVSAGWVSFSGQDRPVVVLTDEGRAVMKGERPARLLLPPTARRAAAATGAGRSGEPGFKLPPMKINSFAREANSGSREMANAIFVMGPPA